MDERSEPLTRRERIAFVEALRKHCIAETRERRRNEPDPSTNEFIEMLG
ncbi:MAG: hypothetical protein GX111_05125 [Clostridiales bacterium]|nr:hypothetical protein [Clostridiales bacterium]